MKVISHKGEGGIFVCNENGRIIKFLKGSKKILMLLTWKTKRNQSINVYLPNNCINQM